MKKLLSLFIIGCCIIVHGEVLAGENQLKSDPVDHWAFQPVVQPEVPSTINSARMKNPIDLFVQERYTHHKLTPQAEAPRLMLLRRLYIDLIGLPPSPEEISQCERDVSPLWYERIVEDLLNDPRYGERWARHWMDIWRYSDAWGLNAQHRNSQKHIWHWRDWIIESLNNDVPYDEMVRLMLSSDESHPTDQSKLRATGFLARNFVLLNRDEWMDTTVEHVSKGFLGLTMNCAKCHEHKYDPIEQADYYHMRAFFEPYHVRLDIVPGETNLEVDGLPRVFDGLPDKPTYLYEQGRESSPDKSIIMVPKVPEFLAFKELLIEPIDLPAEAWQPARNAWVLETYIAEAREKLQGAESAFQQIQEAPDNDKDKLKMVELDLDIARAELPSVERRANAMRASWTNEEATILQDLNEGAIRAERLAILAREKRALADAEKKVRDATPKEGAPADEKKLNDLNAKLEKAETSFQKADEKIMAPIAPDEMYTIFKGAKWSATRFFDSRNDDPAVEFQKQSTGRRTALANWITDPENPLTARVAINHIWDRHLGKPLVSSIFDFGKNGKLPSHPELLDWLAAEFMENGWSMKHIHRLIVTSATYRMGSSTAGFEVNQINDPDNHYLWRREPIRVESQVVRDSILMLSGSLEQHIGGPPIPKDQQAESTRRSLYFLHSGLQRNKFLTQFDEATVEECYRRAQSIVPQQALALSNSSLVLNASGQIAKQISDTTTSERTFIQKAFTSVLCSKPDEFEIEISKQALDDWRELPDSSEESVRAQLIWALINHNDFVTLR